MLTVKQIDISGSETLWTAPRVAFNAKGSPTGDQIHRKPHVAFVDAADNIPVHIFGGTVFVMNEAGATVSRWDLGASPVPLRDDVDGRNSAERVKTAAMSGDLTAPHGSPHADGLRGGAVR